MRIAYERLVGPEYMTPVMRVTSGNKRDYRPKKPNFNTWRKMLTARHSPIRAVMYRFYVFDVPSWVTVHYVRHSIGVQFYVLSQRKNPQRGAAPQETLVDMIFDVNAEALMNIAEKRLCSKAALETRQLCLKIKNELAASEDRYDNILAEKMETPCLKYCMCFEPEPCERFKEKE